MTKKTFEETIEERLSDIASNIIDIQPALPPEEELREIAYQASRIADALHDIKTAMFDVFTYGRGYDNQTISENIYDLSQSLREINRRQYLKEKENERIEANRNAEEDRATRDDSSSMPRKD